MNRVTRRRLVLLLAIALSASCAGRAAPRSTPVRVQAGPSAGDPDSIRWVRDSAEFQALVSQVYRTATTQVESAVAARGAGTWGVVLDADETVISNVPYQVERARLGLEYSAASWRAWVARREATPLPGSAAFLARVRALGGRIAIVTNRLQTECAETEAVFMRHQLAYDAMLCRPDAGPSDKNPRFAAVAAGRSPASAVPIDIVAFVGDNVQDFPLLTQAVRGQGATAFADFGVRYFMLPNPMYGSWQ